MDARPGALETWHSNPETGSVRILYDHQVFSLQNVGGASRYHYELLKYLATVPEVQTELFLGVSENRYPMASLASARTRVPSWRTAMKPGLTRYAVNELLQSVWAPFGGRYEVYHPTYYREMPVVRARCMVVTHHDCVQEEFPHLFGDASRVRRAKTALYGKADRIICISEDCRQRLLQHYRVEAGRTCVVHHGLAKLARSEEAEAELRGHWRQGFLLYVGARDRQKNFSTFLEAFREARLFEDYDLLAVGGGPFSSEETARMASLDVAGCVRCIPSASEELLAEAYAHAVLFVYPSLAEGFGIPPLEAMAAGCPVAASEVTAIPEVCHDAPVYFDPTDVGSMARALTQGVGDQAARKRAIARGHEVAAEYSWEKCGAETLAAYRGCL